jgi:hypothetical protein
MEITVTVPAIRTIGAVALASVLGGCVVTLDSVIQESDAMSDPRLLGTWEEVGGSDRAVVSQADKSTYAIEYASNGKTGRFGARLGRLGERTVLDVWPEPSDAELGPYAGLLVRGHLLMDFAAGADKITTALLESDSLIAALKAGQVRLAHDSSSNQLILKGTTQELRAALAQYLARPGVLDESVTWRRLTPAGAAARRDR